MTVRKPAFIGWWIGGTGAVAVAVAAPAVAQEAARGEWQSVHSEAIAGNLEGNSPKRDVYVVTPPGYDENPERRYPVVYFLHGYWTAARGVQEDLRLDQAVQTAAEAGNEVIMVMPDGFSKLRGGFYASSPTVGDYQHFVADELVEWVDANYRSIADPGSRGLAGHSMGGYGTIRIAMKHPGVFSSIYMMSACCLAPQPLTVETARRIEAMTEQDIANAQFGELAPVTTVAAFSPDPTDDGLLKADTGLRDDGTLDPLVNHRIAANAPIVMLPQYVPALKSLEAFATDIGDKDFLLESNRAFRDELDRFGIQYDFELYEGDHGNRVKERLRTEVLPFFGEHLDAQ